MKKLMAVVLLALTLTACAPTTGQVTDRDYDKSWTETKRECVKRDSKGTCILTDSDQVYHEQRCSLKLRDGDEEGWLAVPCEEYEDYKIGDHYPHDK